MGRRKKQKRPRDSHESQRPESNTTFYLRTAESKRYHECPQTQRIQRELTEECVRMLPLKQGAEGGGRASGVQILNVGCGSGHCGAVIRERGMAWVGADISRLMLNEADASCSGLLLEADCFGRLPFRSASFDHGISISALQWICVSKSPASTARLFFCELSRVLRGGGMFVAQLYPRHQEDVECLQAAAADTGWKGMPYVYTGFPHQSKARKRFMCLKNSVGSSPSAVCSCPLSWPLRMPCGGSDRNRLDREHGEFSTHSLRLLRRAAAGVITGGPVGQESSYSAVDVTCPASCLTPCGGMFSLHVWHEASDGHDEGRASDVLQELLGGSSSFTIKVAQENKTGVRVDWNALRAHDGAEMALRNPNPHFSLRKVQGAQCFVLDCPKRAPLVAVVYSLSRPREFSKSILSGIRSLVSTSDAVTIVGIDVSTDPQGVAHAAVLIYVPSPATPARPEDRTLNEALTAIFPTAIF